MPKLNLDRPFCTIHGKVAHPTKEAALYALHAARRAGHNRRRKLPVDVYECRDGNGWHLSSRRLTRRHYR